MEPETDFVPNEKEPLPKVSDEMRVKLREGFPEEAYSQHPTKTFLTTLKAMYVTERLNDVFGIGRWTMQHRIVSTDNNYVLMSGRLILYDYDCIVPTQYGGHATSGTGTELADGYKSAITDMISKSASYLEIGIDLFQGKIQVEGSEPKGNQAKKQTVSRQLTKDEVDNKWAGKIYGGSVYINKEEIKPPKEQIEKLKKHPKYKPSEKK